jgi:DNA-binding IclR family transcriptional regulator
LRRLPQEIVTETAPAPAAGSRARGLGRAFEILDFLRRQRKPLRPNEIAIGIAAPRSSVYELVGLLLENGTLEYVGTEGRVYLGRRLYFLGLAYAEHFDLGHVAEGLLQRLAEETRETAQMCLLDGHKYTVAMMREGARPFRISSDVGEPVPIPWTASGRLLLSHMSDAEILAFIPPEDFVLPNGKRLDPKKFLAEVHAAKAAGIHTFESITDNFTHCFAAPVLQPDGTCIATLCLVAPREDAAKNHRSYVKALRTAAAEMTRSLASEPDHH